jgi:hypothetical protein
MIHPRGLSISSLLTLCVVVTLLVFCATGQAAEPLDYQVKAAFLLNFAKFIEWPRASFPDATSALEVCVLGDDPLGSALDQIAAGETIDARKVVVQKLNANLPMKSCNVLFIGRQEQPASKILAGLNPGTLTVGDSPDFLRNGGVITFAVENRRVRFDINLKAAESAGLKISSKLLNVARSVER